jgi:hypothetical protein
MTTNAIDIQQLIVSSDSRWSCLVDDQLHFVDDTNFDKIVVNEDAVMICAGDGELIGEWHEWFRRPDCYETETPRTEITRGAITETVCITILGRPDGTILFIRGSYHTIDMHALFAGSGAIFAHGCFTANKCVMKCVQTAACHDFYTGGDVKFYNIVTGENNLSNIVHAFDHVDNEYRARGKVMDITTKKVMDINPKSAANDAAQKNASGFHLSAPTGEAYRPWSADDKDRLQVAVNKLAERAKERKKL